MSTWGPFLARRLAALAATLLAASVLIFSTLALAPGDPATLLAGSSHPSPTTLAAIRQEFHLDESIPVQYWHWLSGLFGGDLGRSIIFRADVSSLISGRIVNTLFLVVYAGLLILVVGIGLGLLGALRGRAVRTAVTAVSTVAMGAPTFVVAVGLIWLFATQLSWFPVFGSGSGFGDRIRHLTLPAIALALAYVAYVARITRVAVTEELHADHVETARSRGLPERLIIRRHVLRNAAAPILSVSGIAVAGLLSSAAVAEQAFGVDGLGSLLIQSAARKDLAVVQAVAMILVAAFVIVNTIVDVVNAALDPRLALRSAA